MLLVATGAVIALWNWQRSLPHAAPVVPTMPTVILPAPAPAAATAADLWLEHAPVVRRAEPVPVVVKRATLLRLPSQEIGVYKWYDLPSVWGGGSVWARYMGTVGRFSEIPPNPVPGDLWNVTETGAGWIYFTPAGYVWIVAWRQW